MSCPVGDISIDVFNMVYLFYFILFIWAREKKRKEKSESNTIQYIQ